MRPAVDARLIARAPCDGVCLPTDGRREMHFLAAEQVSRLATAVGAEWEALVYTAAFAGLLWGELAGLRPALIDLGRRTITVVEQLNELSGHIEWGPPKTTGGRRVVSSLLRWPSCSRANSTAAPLFEGGWSSPHLSEGAGDGRSPPRWPTLSRPSPHGSRVGDQAGRASQGAPGAHGPQLGDRNARSVRTSLREISMGRSRTRLDDLLQSSRGLARCLGDLPARLWRPALRVTAVQGWWG
jgi:integrase